jgi:hypothetical protein
MSPASHSHSDTTDIRLWAVGLSLLLSVWHALLNQIPNADGFEYVRIAEVFLNDGLAAAFALYPSATYPVLIGVLQSFGLDPFVAGQVLNALFYALLVNVFMSIALEVRDTRRHALIAAVVVLAYPQINEYRYYMIRDIACIALVLAGTLQLIRYARAPAWREAGLFCLALLGAALFRAEALAYLFVAPLVLLWRRGVALEGMRGFEPFAGEPAPTRPSIPGTSGAWLRLQGLVVGLAVMGVLVLGIAGVDVPGTLLRIATVYLPFLTAALQALGESNTGLSDAIFGEYAADFSGEHLWLFMLGGMTTLLIFKLVSGFGVPALLVLVYGWRTRTLPITLPALRPLLFNAGIAFAILLAFLLLTRFLSSRYTLLFCMLLLPLLTLVLDAAIERLSLQPRVTLAKGILGFALLFCMVDAHVSFGRSKQSLEQASEWLRNNAVDGSVLLTNNNYVAYYSGMVADYDKVLRYIDFSVLDNATPGTLLAMSLDRGMDVQLQSRADAGQLVLLAQFPLAAQESSNALEFAIYRRVGN